MPGAIYQLRREVKRGEARSEEVGLVHRLEEGKDSPIGDIWAQTKRCGFHNHVVISRNPGMLPCTGNIFPRASGAWKCLPALCSSGFHSSVQHGHSWEASQPQPVNLQQGQVTYLCRANSPSAQGGQKLCLSLALHTVGAQQTLFI